MKCLYSKLWFSSQVSLLCSWFYSLNIWLFTFVFLWGTDISMNQRHSQDQNQDQNQDQGRWKPPRVQVLPPPWTSPVGAQSSTNMWGMFDCVLETWWRWWCHGGYCWPVNPLNPPTSLKGRRTENRRTRVSDYRQRTTSAETQGRQFKHPHVKTLTASFIIIWFSSRARPLFSFSSLCFSFFSFLFLCFTFGLYHFLNCTNTAVGLTHCICSFHDNYYFKIQRFLLPLVVSDLCTKQILTFLNTVNG